MNTNVDVKYKTKCEKIRNQLGGNNKIQTFLEVGELMEIGSGYNVKVYANNTDTRYVIKEYNTNSDIDLVEQEEYINGLIMEKKLNNKFSLVNVPKLLEINKSDSDTIHTDVFQSHQLHVKITNKNIGENIRAGRGKMVNLNYLLSAYIN